MSADMIFIFLLALILFGPKKLPEIARQIGKFMAEFKRASNDFTSQLQSEIEKTGTEIAPSGTQGDSTSVFTQQNTSTFVQTLLPPAVKTAITEIDTAHDRLMATARMAFDAQNFALRPPESPVVATTATDVADAPLSSETNVAQSSAAAASHESSPVETVTDQPTHVPAPATSESAPQSS